jgi:hypothetical protein
MIQLGLFLNVLIRGDYNDHSMEKNLINIKMASKKGNFNIIKTANHKNIPYWKYFFF